MSLLIVVVAVTTVVSCALDVNVSREAFFDAIRDDDLEGVEQACNAYAHTRPVWRYWQLGDYVDSCPNPAATGLHVAVEHGHQRIVACLNGWGADVNAVDSDGNTPLHVACRLRQVGIVEQLLKRRGRTNLEVVNSDGLTPLGVAVGLFNPGTQRPDNVIVRIITVLRQARAQEHGLFDFENSSGLERQRRLALVRAVATADELFRHIGNGDSVWIRAFCYNNARWADWTDPETDRNRAFQAALATLRNVGVNAPDNVARPANDRSDRLDGVCRFFARHPYTNVATDVYAVGNDGVTTSAPSLHLAAEFGSPSLLGDIIDRAPTLINALHEGMTALDVCAARLSEGRDDEVMTRWSANRDLLVFGKGADIWAGQRLAFCLSVSRNVTMTYLRQSVDVNELVNTPCDGGRSPLQNAIRTRSDDVVLALIDAGADVNPSGRRTPVLHDAIRSGLSRDVIVKLASHPDVQVGQVDEAGDTPLSVAARCMATSRVAARRRHYLEVIRLLLQVGARPSAPLGSLFAYDGDLEAVLSEPRAPYVRSDPRPALFQGLLDRDPDRVRQVCHDYPYWHAWRHRDGRTPFDIVLGSLQQACTGNATEWAQWDAMAVFLGRASPYPDPRSLQVAARYGSVDLVDAIANANPHLVNRRDSNGLTPLAWCSWDLYWNRPASHRLAPIRDSLLRRWQADIDPVSFILALDVAVARAYLTRSGANINAAIRTISKVSVPQLAPAGASGYTALHMALLERSTSNVDLAVFLIDQGANLTAVDDRGRTPLHLAGRAGLASVVRRILDAAGQLMRIDIVDVRDRDGKTPLMLAHEHAGADGSHADTIGLLAGRSAATPYVVMGTLGKVTLAALAIAVISTRARRSRQRRSPVVQPRPLSGSTRGKAVVVASVAVAAVALASTIVASWSRDPDPPASGTATSPCPSNANSLLTSAVVVVGTAFAVTL